MKTFYIIISILIIVFLITSFIKKDIDFNTKTLIDTESDIKAKLIKEQDSAIPLKSTNRFLKIMNRGKCFLELTNISQADILIQSVVIAESGRNFNYPSGGHLLKPSRTFLVSDELCTIDNNSIIFIKVDDITYIWTDASI